MPRQIVAIGITGAKRVGPVDADWAYGNDIDRRRQDFLGIDVRTAFSNREWVG